MRTLILIFLSFQMIAQISMSDTYTMSTANSSTVCNSSTHEPVSKFQAWGTENMTRYFHFVGVSPTGNYACYMSCDTCELVVKDTMATIRMFYLDMKLKQKEIDKLSTENEYLFNIIDDLHADGTVCDQKNLTKAYKRYIQKYRKNCKVTYHKHYR